MDDQSQGDDSQKSLETPQKAEQKINKKSLCYKPDSKSSIFNPDTLCGVELDFTNDQLKYGINHNTYRDDGEICPNSDKLVHLYLVDWIEKIKGECENKDMYLEVEFLPHQDESNQYRGAFSEKLLCEQLEKIKIYPEPNTESKQDKFFGIKDEIKEFIDEKTLERQGITGNITRESLSDINWDINKNRFGRVRIKIETNRYEWYWDITLDSACFEIQTPPTPFKQYLKDGSALELINSTIFKCSKDAKLDSTDGEGGLQINIDFNTGLNNDYGNVLKAIISCEMKRESFKDAKQTTGKINLAVNRSMHAAYLNEKRFMWINDPYTKDIATELSKLQLNLDENQQKCWEEEFFPLYVMLMRTKPTEEQWRVYANNQLPKESKESQIMRGMSYNDFVKEADCKNYLTSTGCYNDEIERFQAVNITNIGNINPETRRIEFRDFYSCYCEEDFLKCFEHVKSILEM
ncbi:hypothetical protein [Pseudoalteromonas denitrificans]|uniref:Uncharacterized protein n=1 Tax=Pseudoalteromonas denitrificans DSM 6059 TaxID=1123010 RepID=A0A1I1U9H2_9GAMM|nr:hypothetical protein [Pseudoalteromonas denitrificans]SFD67285.1 hypothetical protein SAMN02745724_05153 [Pseudoalteromonas denitrificans DSM 6059]